MRRTAPALIFLVPALALGCRSATPATGTEIPPDAAPRDDRAVVDAGEVPEAPVEARTVLVAGDLPVFYVAGGRRADARSRMVFLHGACTHGLGYIQSFAFTAAERGSLMALQGENDCGHSLRSWTSTPQKANARIEAGFAAAKDARDGPIVAIGYSQGAMVAASLAAAYPTRYRRVILIGAPRVLDARALSGLEGAVLMAGTLDNVALMKESERALQRGGVPATFIELPGARHGQLPDAEAIMGRALAWLEQNAKPR